MFSLSAVYILTYIITWTQFKCTFSYLDNNLGAIYTKINYLDASYNPRFPRVVLYVLLYT